MNIAWSHLGHLWLNAALTGLYQGLALAAVVWLLLKCLPRTNAATRHAIRWAALVVIAALPIVHWIIALASSQRPELNSSRETPSPIAPSPSAPAMSNVPLTFELPHEPIVVSFEKDFKDTSTSPREEELTHGLETPIVTRPASTFRGEPDPASISGDPPWRPKPFRQLTLPHGTGLILMAVWASLALTRLLFLGRQSLALANILRNGRAPSEAWRRRFESIRDEMGLKRKVRLRMAPSLNGPIVTGFWRPAILFPAELFGQLEPRDWERIMRHELAHVARYDDWTNGWEQVIAAVWFFHPAVWWMKRDLALDREIACDDHVLATPSPARRYALLLTQFASQTHHRKWTAAPAAWNHRSQLKQRIDMLLDPTRNACPRLSRTRAGTLLIALGLATAGALQFTPRLAFSRHNPSADELLIPPRKQPVTEVEGNKEALASEDAARNESVLGSSYQNANRDEIFVVKPPSAAIVSSRPDARLPFHSASVTVPAQASNQPAGSSTISSSRGARPDVAGAPPPPPPAPPAPPPPPTPSRLAAPEVSAQATVDVLRANRPSQESPVAEPREESLERRMERLERMVGQMLKMQTPPGRAEDIGHVERGSRSESGAHANILRKEHRSTDILDAEAWPSEKDKSAKVTFKEAEEQFRTAQKELHDAFQHEDLARLQRLHDLEQVNHLAVERQILEKQRRALQHELEILEKRIAELEAKRSADPDGQDDNGFWLKRKDSESLPSN